MEWIVKKRTEEKLLNQILINRGITADKFNSFLRPDFARDLFDPYLLSDMDKAVARIAEAVKSNDKIGIFADYDADGIPGAALLYRALTAIGAKAVVYIPSRESGYGLSEEGINYLVSEGAKLIITIDLGIRSIAEARYCSDKKIDLIISDHHLPGSEIPDAFAVINPKKPGDEYPFKDLCGCAVSYKIIQALAVHYPSILNETFLKWNLDLVAISTIADVVSVVGENRVFVKYGLTVLNKTRNIGIKKLIQNAALKMPIGSYGVGFQIAPRINAPGRIDHATKSFEILVSDDQSEVDDLASCLEEKNIERQDQMATVEQEAVLIIEKNKLDSNNIIIAHGDWPKGVMGPTASRLVERYYKPVVLLSKEQESYTGSARSISGINIVDLLEAVSQHLIKFGGHAGAAGLSVSENNLDKFIAAMVTKSAKIPAEIFARKLKIDCEVLASEMNLQSIKVLDQLEPYGLSNPRPVFVLRDAEIKYLRMVGKDAKHASFCSLSLGQSFKSIYFDKGENMVKIENGQKYDLAFNVEIDNWNDNEQVSLKILDLKKSSVSREN
ncbi:MAG: single-stranded-DNA-specific exonuclease RecJ [Candidatus Berkelbacteria bacterium]